MTQQRFPALSAAELALSQRPTALHGPNMDFVLPKRAQQRLDQLMQRKSDLQRLTPELSERQFANSQHGESERLTEQMLAPFGRDGHALMRMSRRRQSSLLR